MAAAMREELVAASAEIEPTIFLAETGRLHDTGRENRFSTILLRYGLQADCRISEVDIGLGKPHPYVKLSDLMECLDREGKIGSLLLMGHTPEDYVNFWECYRGQAPNHAVFQHHAHNLHACIPFFLHADEGVTHKKKSLMILSSHPILGRGWRLGPDVNFCGSTLLTRFMFSVLLGRLYKKKAKALLDLTQCWSRDWQDMFHKGVRTTSHGHIFLIGLGLKGDWPSLVKLGRLTRHHLRDAPCADNGVGICHRCAAGQRHYPWYETGFDSSWLTNEAPVDLPWGHGKASHLTQIPQDPDLTNFFLVDLFHTAHKGVVADYAASATDPCSNCMFGVRLFLDIYLYKIFVEFEVSYSASNALEVTLMDLGLAGDGGLAKRFDYLYESAQRWCKMFGESLHMVHFTSDLFGLASKADDFAGSLDTTVGNSFIWTI